MNNNKILWACRRGMLELDLFLLPFAEHCYNDLTNTEKQHFQALLEFPDPVLFDYLMANKTTDRKELATIVEKIRTYKHHHSAERF